MEVLLRAGPQSHLERLSPKAHVKILQVLERLSRWPRVPGAKQVKGKEGRMYVFAAGNYDGVFLADEQSLVVTRIRWVGKRGRR